jgi:hypothetical protein
MRVEKDGSSGTYLSPQKSPKAAIAVLGERTEFRKTMQAERAAQLRKLMDMNAQYRLVGPR